MQRWLRSGVSNPTSSIAPLGTLSRPAPTHSGRPSREWGQGVGSSNTTGPMTKRLITGSRHWPTSLWWKVWEECHGADSLVLGDCPTGADLWARRFAQFYQVEHRVHLADWRRHRARAGPLRNTEMVKDRPDDAVAFLVQWDPCHGTRDCWQKCIRANIPVRPVYG